MEPGANAKTQGAQGAVLLLGGRSEIGLKVAERIAAGRTVVLAARRGGELGEEARSE
ncbi:MAG: hypothetical protein HOW97_19255, partial [Catenulispora sp.]|nr:hypothetical protein [Catenulispora sp.]